MNSCQQTCTQGLGKASLQGAVAAGCIASAVASSQLPTLDSHLHTVWVCTQAGSSSLAACANCQQQALKRLLLHSDRYTKDLPALECAVPDFCPSICVRISSPAACASVRQ